MKSSHPKHDSQWKWASVGDGDMYILWNAPIEVLGTTNRLGRWTRVAINTSTKQLTKSGNDAGVMHSTNLRIKLKYISNRTHHLFCNKIIGI